MKSRIKLSYIFMFHNIWWLRSLFTAGKEYLSDRTCRVIVQWLLRWYCKYGVILRSARLPKNCLYSLIPVYVRLCTYKILQTFVRRHWSRGGVPCLCRTDIPEYETERNGDVRYMYFKSIQSVIGDKTDKVEKSLLRRIPHSVF